MKQTNLTLQEKRKHRVRSQVKARTDRPRLVVTRTNLHIYAQVIDQTGKTIASSSDAMADQEISGKTKSERAEWVGTDIAAKAQKAKVDRVAFDRGHYKYHGRVKALAEAARNAGLEF